MADEFLPSVSMEDTWVSGAASACMQVADAVVQLIPVLQPHLPHAFYPAHLPVALIDAVLHSRVERGQVPGAERYCKRFGIARTRSGWRELPENDEQEALEVLIRRFDTLGVHLMSNVIVPPRYCPKTIVTIAEEILILARALQRVGVRYLQDVQRRKPKAVFGALRSVTKGESHVARRLLSYAGRDDFVLGDAHVRRFVADALDRETVSSTRAAALVRRAAYELVLSPRYLDHEIWRFGVARSRSSLDSTPHRVEDGVDMKRAPLRSADFGGTGGGRARLVAVE